MFGDLNAKVGNLPVEAIVRFFGVPVANENKETLIQMSVERDLSDSGEHVFKVGGHP